MRGKMRDGWDDACRGDRDGGRWITINGVAPGDCDRVFDESEKIAVAHAAPARG